MQTSTDIGEADSTGPHSELPPAIARSLSSIGAWIRYGLIALIALMTLVATAMSVVDIVKSARITIADVRWTAMVSLARGRVEVDLRDGGR